MRIALARRGYSPTGGAENYLRRLAGGLAALGHTPVLVTTEDWPETSWPHPDILRVEGATPGRFSKAVDAVRARHAWDFLYSLERVAHCDAYRAGDGVHAAWLDRRRGFEPAWRGVFRRLRPKHRQLLDLEARLFREGTRRIIANSRMVADEIIDRFQVEPRRLHLIPNGYDLPSSWQAKREPWRTRIRGELGLADEDILVLFTGTGWERKGLATLVEALGKGANPRLHLVVAGRGRAGLLDGLPRCHQPPLPVEIPACLAAADLFVLPTWYDPFSNACLEAAAHGLPVLTTYANGFAEHIRPGVTGDVFQAGDSAALAALLAAWADPERIGAARAAAPAAVAHLTVEANVRATLEVFQAAAA